VLSGNPPGGGWVAALADARPRRLRTFTLEDNQPDGASVALLAQAEALGELREIGDEGAVALAGSSTLSRLEGVGGLPLLDAGARPRAPPPQEQDQRGCDHQHEQCR